MGTTSFVHNQRAPFTNRSVLNSRRYSFSRATRTKYPTLHGLNNRDVSSHSSEGQRSETQVWTGPAPSEGGEGESVPPSPLAAGGCWESLLLLGLQKHHPYLCLHVHTAFSLYACVCVQISPFIRTLIVVA